MQAYNNNEANGNTTTVTPIFSSSSLIMNDVRRKRQSVDQVVSAAMGPHQQNSIFENNS